MIIKTYNIKLIYILYCMNYNIVNPYIYSVLDVKIGLKPEQMNNKLYINLKDNLTKKVDKKCYKNYGYVSEIYKLLDIGNGVICAENLTGSSIFNISFSCKLCRIVENTQLICKITKITRALSLAENGPIVIIITNDKINNDIFFFDNNNYLRYRDNTKSKKIEQGDFVIVTILNKEFHHKDERIKAIGFLNGVATENDVVKYYEDYHKDVSNADENDDMTGGNANKSSSVEVNANKSEVDE